MHTKSVSSDPSLRPVVTALIPSNEDSFLRLPAVQARVPYSRSAIYAMVAEGRFPAPVRLGDRAVAWLSSEVSQWIDERMREARQSGGSHDRMAA